MRILHVSPHDKKKTPGKQTRTFRGCCGQSERRREAPRFEPFSLLIGFGMLHVIHRLLL
jgi:hypothetical protein